ncbi:MAG: poly-beta-1,6 N-acetyl-D-glucosamine export porin PgaA [Halioglobus sp.]
MLKNIFSFLIPLAVLGVLFYELFNTPFYSEGELAGAREKTVALAREGKFEEAFNRFDALFDIAPDDQKVWGDYVIVLIWDDQERRALALSEQHLDLSEAALYIIHEIFAAYLRQGHHEKALRAALLALPRSEDPAHYAVVRSRQLSTVGALAEAKRLLEAASAVASDDPRLIAARLAIELNGGASEAEDELRRELAQNPNDPDLRAVQVEAAVLRARAGDYGDALAHFEGRYRSEPDNVKVASEYLTLLSWSGAHEQAVGVYMAHAGQGLDDHAREAAAISLLSTGEVEEGTVILEVLAAIDPDNQRYLRGLAMARVARADPDGAVALLESVKEAEADTLEQLGYLYASQQKPKRAAVTHGLAFALQAPEQRAYLPWFDAIEAATKRSGISPFLDDLRQYLPGLAGNPIVARYIVMLLRYDQDELAREIAAEYPYSAQRPAGQSKQDSAPGDRLAKQLQWEAKTARDERNLALAVKLSRFGLEHYPNNRQLQLGLAIGLSESGKQREPTAILKQLAETYPADQQIQNAAVYHFRKYKLDDALMASLERLMPLSAGTQRDRVLMSWVTTLLSNRVYADTPAQLAALERIGRYHPDSTRWWLTLALLQSREGRCDAAVQALAKVSPSQSDLHMLDNAGFIARQCENYALAEVYYARGIERYGHRPEMFAGLALSITDGGDAQRALQMLQPVAASLGADRDFLFARAYASAAAGEHEAAAEDYQALLQRWPDDKEAFLEYVMSVNYAGDPQEAIRMGEQREDWLSKKHWQRLHADEATISLRAVDRSDLSRAEKKRLTDDALAKIDRNIAELESALPIDDKALQNARFDRVSALYLGEEMQRSVDEYLSLEISPGQSPAYLLVMVADASMHVNNPALAIELLTEAQQRNPQDGRAQAALFYAYLDSEQYERAEAVIQAMQAGVTSDQLKGWQAEETPWQWKLAAMFEAYRNRLGLAQRNLEQWLVQTPADTDLKIKLGAIYRWRGWPDKAIAIYDEVMTQEPDSLDARVGRGYALIQRREYEQAEAQIEQLVADDAGNGQVQLMQSDWALHNSSQLDSRISLGKSDGGAFANNELVSDTYLYSEPLQNNYRAFAHTYIATAELPGDEGNADVLRLGVGGQYRSRALIASAEVSEALDNDGDVGVTLSGTWLPDDYWSLNAKLQTYSLLVPVRAINQGIDGESVELSLKHQWNEGHYIRGAGSYSQFSDDNERRSLYLSHYHRVYEDEHHTVALMEQAYWSDNSGGSNVPYFNPEEDRSLSATLLYDGVLWRRLEKKFSHSLAIGVGVYDQDGFSNSFIWDIEYSHTWTHSRFLEWTYGLLHRDRSYDGEGEYFNAIFGRVNWRF